MCSLSIFFIFLHKVWVDTYTHARVKEEEEKERKSYNGFDVTSVASNHINKFQQTSGPIGEC